MKYKYLLFLTAWCWGALPSSIAQADEHYMNVALGQFDILDEEPGISFPVKAAGVTITWGQDFGKYSGIETKLFASQSGTSGAVTMSTSGFATYYNPHVELMDNLRVHAPIGLAVVTIDREVSGFPKEQARTARISYGAGMAYSVSDTLLVTADWMRYLYSVNMGTNGLGIQISVSSVMAGVSFYY